MAKDQQRAIREARKAHRDAKVTQRQPEIPSNPPGEVIESTPEGEIAYLAYLAIHGSNVPKNFWEATRGPDADKWWNVMHEEIDLLTRRRTWVVVELPDERKEIGCQWTYDIKYRPKGEVL
jgi:hypothetical protein